MMHGRMVRTEHVVEIAFIHNYDPYKVTELERSATDPVRSRCLGGSRDSHSPIPSQRLALLEYSFINPLCAEPNVIDYVARMTGATRVCMS